MCFYCVADIRKPFTQGDLHDHSGQNIIQALTENISNSEKNATRMRNDINFHFFQNLRIFINHKKKTKKRKKKTTVYTVSQNSLSF